MQVVRSAVVVLVLFANMASAHFNMLLLDKDGVKKGDTVTLTYQWGHPFEHQFFDAPRPLSLIVITPDGQTKDLLKSLEQIKLAVGEGKTATAYRLPFQADQRGDYVFVLRTPPIWLAEENAFVQDTAKVVLHVQAQKGWDAASGDEFELVPLTRPYGLTPGSTFQVQVEGRVENRGGEGSVRRLIEIERYNTETPKELPPDEHITRTAKTDRTGAAVVTLPEQGWWSITASRPNGVLERKGAEFPLTERATLWLFVSDPKSR